MRKPPGPRVVALALALVAGGLACAPSQGLPAVADSERVVVTPLLATQRACASTARVEHVLRNMTEWKAWWDRIHCGAAPVPAVDFTSSVVLAVEDDPGPNSCYKVRLEDVRVLASGEVLVRAVREVPSQDATCMQVMVAPAAAVAIPAPRGSVNFSWDLRAGPQSPR